MIPRLGTHSRPQMSETGAATRNGEICGFSLSPLAADGNGIGGSDMIKCTRYAIISIRKELRGRPLTLYHELDSTLVAKKKGRISRPKFLFCYVLIPFSLTDVETRRIKATLTRRWEECRASRVTALLYSSGRIGSALHSSASRLAKCS